MKRKNIKDIDMNNAYFHFTEKGNLKSIAQNGLKAQIGDASKLVDDKSRVCFSQGVKGILGIKNSFIWEFEHAKICDIPEGYKKYFDIKDFSSTDLIPKEIVYEALKRKCRVIEEAIEKYSLRDADAFTILKTVGGLDIAGLTGVFIGAAIEQIPVVIDGVISAVAALLAETLCKGAVNYMIPSHKSRELAETAIMKKLHLEPVLDADMALGEGTGAVMMMSLLDVALGVYLQGASFANFEIEQYKRYEE